MTKYSSAKMGNIQEYLRIFPNFQNCMHGEKDLKNNKDNSRHLGQKYAWIFLLGHYLFLVSHSFPGASLSENCSLLRTDNVRLKISVYIFTPNADYCLFILLASVLSNSTWKWIENMGGGSPLNWRTFGSVRLVTFFTVPKIAALQNFSASL